MIIKHLPKIKKRATGAHGETALYQPFWQGGEKPDSMKTFTNFGRITLRPGGRCFSASEGKPWLLQYRRQDGHSPLGRDTCKPSLDFLLERPGNVDDLSPLRAREVLTVRSNWLTIEFSRLLSLLNNRVIP